PQERPQTLYTQLEIRHAEPFILRMRLGDGAGAEGDGGDAFRRKDRGVAEPGGAGQACAASLEGADDRMRRIGVERRGMIRTQLDSRAGQLEAGADVLDQRGEILRGDGA